MGSVKHKGRQISVCVVSIALSVAVECIGPSLQRLSAQSRKAARQDVFLQAYGGRQVLVDPQSGGQHFAVLLLQRCGTELPSLRPFVHLGVGLARMSIIGRGMAIADRRRMAADGEALRWRQ